MCMCVCVLSFEQAYRLWLTPRFVVAVFSLVVCVVVVVVVYNEANYGVGDDDDYINITKSQLSLALYC